MQTTPPAPAADQAVAPGAPQPAYPGQPTFGPLAAAPAPAKKGCSPLVLVGALVVLVAIVYAALCFLAPDILKSTGIPNVIAPPAPAAKGLTAEDKKRLSEEKDKKDEAKAESGEPARERAGRDEGPAQASPDTGEVQLDPSGMGGGVVPPGRPGPGGGPGGFVPPSGGPAPEGGELRAPPVPPSDAAGG